MLSFYGMSYRDVLELPISAFWLLSNNINRLSAERDIRSLAIAAGSQSEEGYKKTLEGLQREMGDVVKNDAPEAVGMEHMAAFVARLNSR